MVAQRVPGPLDPCQGSCGAAFGSRGRIIRPGPVLT